MSAPRAYRFQVFPEQISDPFHTLFITLVHWNTNAEGPGQRAGFRQPFAQLRRQRHLVVLAVELDAECERRRKQLGIVPEINVVERRSVRPRVVPRKLELELRLEVRLRSDRRRGGDVRLEASLA